MNSQIRSLIELEPVPPHVAPERVLDFDMFHPVGGEGDLHAAWRRLQAPGVPALVWTPRNGGHWIATRARWIREMFADYEHFSSKCIFLPKESGEQYRFIPTSMDPPEHGPYRELLMRAIGLGAIRRLEPMIRKIAQELIDDLQPRGECNFTTEYAQQFPVRVFLAMVDLPLKDAAWLKKIGDQMTRPDGSMTLADATQAFFDYLAPFIEQRAKNPGEDAISVVVNGSVNGRKPNKQEALGLCGLLLLAGLDTVVNFLGFAMSFLAQSVSHRRELIETPSLIPVATEELFRRFPVVADGRLITRDIVRDGAQLKAGEMILLPTLLHGLDENENPEPMNVDFRRNRISHAIFGGGPHRCAGQHLARIEVHITLQEWLKRIPDFRIAPGKPIVHLSGIVCAVEGLPLVWNATSADAPIAAQSARKA